MKKVVYYVTVSIDGFICGLDADVPGFVSEGNEVKQYLDDLKEFETVIMGRNTYEFGYAYGLISGQPSYPYIFSKSLHFKDKHEKIHLIPDVKIDKINELKKTSKLISIDVAEAFS